MRKLKTQVVAFLIALTPFYLFAQDSVHAEGTPNIDRWGFEIGWGSQSYIESVTRVGLLSPTLHKMSDQSQVRLVFDWIYRRHQQLNLDAFDELTLSVEFDGKIHKDIVYSFIKFGAGTILMDRDIYDRNLFVVPVSLGFQVITEHLKKGVISNFVDYCFVLTDYDVEKSHPAKPNAGVRREA